MKYYQAHKSSLFLIEIIIAIAFFSLASAVCLQLFVKSHSLSADANELNNAVNLTTSAAESFRQCNGSTEELAQLFPQLKITGENTLAGYYDKDFSSCEKDTASYVMQVSISTEDDLCSANIAFKSTENRAVIYELPVQVHIPNQI